MVHADAAIGGVPVPKGYVEVAFGSIKDADDAGLCRGIRGCLRHLPLGVHLAAIDGQPESAEQEDAHCHHDKNDSLPLFAAESDGGAFQNTMIPCEALPKRNVFEK